MRSFNIEVETKVYRDRVVDFAVGDTVEFSYTDVSSKTGQRTRGAVVGFWNDYPVILEDDWKNTGLGSHRCMIQLQPDNDIIKVVRSEYISDHPSKTQQLAWNSKRRKSISEPRDVEDQYSNRWVKRGTGLGEFRFDVELEDPNRPQTRFAEVNINI